MLFDLFRNLKSSPKPNSLDVVVSFSSIDSETSEGILSEMIKISQESVFQVRSEISNGSLITISLIDSFPKTPSFSIKFFPEKLDWIVFIGVVRDFSLEVIKSERRLRENIKRIDFLLNWFLIFIIILFNFFLLLILLFFFLLFFWLLSFLLSLWLFGFLSFFSFLSFWLFSFWGNLLFFLFNKDKRSIFFLGIPSLSKNILELLGWRNSFIPLSHIGVLRSSFLVEKKSV